MITSIGPHVVRHGNVMDSQGMDDLIRAAGGSPFDLMYCDPPWANLRYWATLNRKQTGHDVVQPELDDFMAQLFHIAFAFVRNTVLMDYGIKWRDSILATARAHGFVHVAQTTTVYGRPPRPLHLHLFQKTPVTGADALAALTGMTGYPAVAQAVGTFHVPGGTVFDPCCGMGYSARAAVEHGMRFVGNELNEKRLQKTIDFLRSCR